MKKIKENIYYVGAVNPNMRVFDIIMKTEYGTTYNAYLVRGGEKTALVETVHDDYFDVLAENIEQICPLTDIDYIIMNHTEPDHSGAIERLLEIKPDITIVGSNASLKNIENISNREFKKMPVKTGDTLDLGGGVEFSFIIAPNLHWPDSMFSYLKNQRTVFTCDFLGCHYCEPQITDEKIMYEKAYDEAFLNYFTAIFGPFGKFVRDGLDKLSELDFDMVCTSHGPILKTKVDKAIRLYRKWSEHENTEKHVSVFYVSAYGYTKSMAEAIEREMNLLGIKTESYNIIENDLSFLAEKLNSSSAVMFGSPTINRDALKPVWDLISCADAVNIKGKPAFVFGSYGWSGEAVPALSERLKRLGYKLPIDEFRVIFKPTENDFNKIKEISKEFSDSIK